MSNIETYFKTLPYAKQREAWEVSKDKEAFGLFMEMGTGKTKVIIDTISYLYREQGLDAVVLVAPKGVYMNWVRKELPRHAGFPYEAQSWSSTNSKKKAFLLERLASKTYEIEGVKVICINTEALSHDKPVYFLNNFMKAHPNCLMVIDESTDIKTPSSNVCKHIGMLGGRAKWRRIMTGTPITQSPLDIYGQFAFLGRALLGFPTFQTFKCRFADIVQMRMGPRTFPKIVGYRRLNELHDLIAPHVFRVKKEECFDLPAKTFEERYVDWMPGQKKLYDQMKAEAFIAINGGMATATIALTKLMKMHQIACGHVIDDNRVTHSFAEARTKALLQVIEKHREAGEDRKTIVWVSFREDVRHIKAILVNAYGEKSVVTFDGDNESREDAKQRFEEDPECLFFVSTAASGGRGITLLKGTLMVFYSYTFSLEDQLQAEDRSHRLGQTEPVHIVKLCLIDSIDEQILASHDSKMELADMVLVRGAAILESDSPQELQDA